MIRLHQYRGVRVLGRAWSKDLRDFRRRSWGKFSEVFLPPPLNTALARPRLTLFCLLCWIQVLRSAYWQSSCSLRCLCSVLFTLDAGTRHCIRYVIIMFCASVC